MKHITMNSLLSIKVLVDNSYTTIFHPHDEGATVHHSNTLDICYKDKAMLQGWRDENYLWWIPLSESKQGNGETKDNIRPRPEQSVNSVYELPSAAKVVRYLHAALGFPTKSTLLTATNNRHLVSFPGLTAENVSRRFPESDKM